jgi:hypothetical protein
MDVGWVLGTKPIKKSIFLSSGNPGNSSLKTLGNPHVL